jgi:flagellar hook-associated protein FlgK
VEQIKTDLAALTERVDALEDKLDEQVASLTQLINGKVVVTDVVTEGNETTVTLSDGSTFTIDNSKSTAVAGDDYTIGAYADCDVYYWAVFKNGNFEKFLEVDGQKVAGCVNFAEGVTGAALKNFEVLNVDTNAKGGIVLSGTDAIVPVIVP